MSDQLPDQATIIRTLHHLRETLRHRMLAPDIAPAVFNECRAHMMQIDKQLAHVQSPWQFLPEIPYRRFTRAERRAERRATGKTFTERVAGRAGSVLK